MQKVNFAYVLRYIYLYSLESTKPLQAESTWSCATADAKNLVVKVTHSVTGPFNEIIICTIFISVNAFKKFLSHELILVIHGYDQRMSKFDLHYQDCRNKGFMLTVKEV